ncbi:MAG: response regulator [Alphaproteobacteria bacterium]
MDDASRRACILIVDDATENLDVLKNALMDDYIVRPAKNGALALRLAAMDPQPDIILLDIMMPDMDGYEVCRQLKRDIATRDIPVIFATAKSDDQDELKGLELGAVDYITKPISFPILKSRIKTYLALRQINQDMEAKNRRLYEINEKLSDSLDQLSASEERFRVLVQTIPDIVYKIDDEGRFTFLNKSVERLGYHQSDLIGRHFTEIIYSADIRDASLDKVLERIGKGTTNPDQKVFDERRTDKRMTIGLQIRLKTKSGGVAELAEVKSIDHSTINVEVNSTGLYGDLGSGTTTRTRTYVGTVGVIRDVTERTKAQNALMAERKLLKELIDSVPLPIFFIQSGGELIFSNEAFRQFNHLGRDDVTGTHIATLFNDEDGQEIEQILTDIRADDTNKRFSNVITIASKEGVRRTIKIMLSKFIGTDQSDSSLIGVMVDVTEENAYTELLIKARQFAEEASRVKSDFLANMSHEIRTPMNAIIGLTRLCLRTELTDKQRDYLSKTIASAEALLGIINDILDFSKIEAGKLDIELIPFNLDRVLDNVAVVMSGKTEHKSLELLFFHSPDVPRNLVGDPLRVGQILSNLISNAIKFTEAGEVVLSVQLLARTDATVRLEFSVRDTGIGMTPEQMQRLFKSFSQADTSTTRKFGGTGLGLAISKQLVEMMGGAIGVDSTPGVGSVFTFSLPFEVAGQSEHTTLVPASDLRDLRVVIVDDNLASAEILRNYLDTFSFQSRYYGSGEEALAALAADTNGVDLILMDWVMPGLNGLETAERIKRDLFPDRPPKIILLTAFGRDDVSHEPGAECLDNILSKPVNPSVLFDAIMMAFGEKPSQIHAAGGSGGDYMLRPIQGARILLVEDNEVNQQVATELLQQARFVVDVANHGLEAIEMLEPGRYDCVLMDMQMPVMDGLEATRRIRADERFTALPILAMTANAMKADRQRTFEAGMNDHITKPIKPDELFDALLRWIPAGERLLPERYVASNPDADDTASPPFISGLDTADGIARMAGNVGAYRRLLVKFADNQVNTAVNIRDALARGDGEVAVRLAHTLKGVAGNIGATALHPLARDLEAALIGGGTAQLDGLVAATGDELARLITAIDSTRQQPDRVVGQTLGAADLLDRLRELRELLSQYDSEAEDLLSAILAQVSDAALLQSLKTLYNHVSRDDFDGALAALDVLIGDIAGPDEGGPDGVRSET